MLTLEKGCPSDLERRPEKERRVYRLLDELGVSYQRLDHEAVMTIDACAEIDRALGAMICKNLFLCDRHCRDFYLLMLPGNKKFNAKAVAGQLGVPRLSFAKEDHLKELLDLTPGSVTVMGLMNDREGRVQLLIDRAVLQDEHIACHPCVNTASIRFPTQVMLEKVLPAMHHAPVYVDLPG